jgi:hypothetical protein
VHPSLQRKSTGNLPHRVPAGLTAGGQD